MFSCIPDDSLLLDIRFSNVFSHFCWLSFHFFECIIHGMTFKKILVEFFLISVSLVAFAIRFITKKILPYKRLKILLFSCKHLKF